MLDHIGYNNLLMVTEADKTFTYRQQWFQKLAPLLGRAEFRDIYNLCLVHRHFNLQPGERMVATGLITQPEVVPASDSTPSDIIPSSWTSAGIPFEWKRVKAPAEIVAPPPAELVREFSEIVGEGSVLGISLAQDPLPEGEIWCEHSNYDLRQHILEIKPVEVLSGGQASDTCWKIKVSSDGGPAEVIFVNGCKCTESDPHQPHPPPPPVS
ncbi:hypothetical protein H1R20_g8583, partial [Candolleomyces eurysporus]